MATSRRPSRRDATATEAREAEPIRILVAGQTGAGKSSLVNALADAVEAAVDALPATARFTAYRLTREGLPTALIIDSPGLTGADGHQALIEATHDCDMVLWVASAARAAREVDAQALAAIREHFAAEPSRHRPPMLLVLTHIDQLRPFDEWEPPYDLGAGHAAESRGHPRCHARPRAGSSASPPSEIVPVRADIAVAPYNIDALWAKIIELMPEAQRARLLRTLADIRGASAWGAVWSQAANAGRVIAGDVSNPEHRPMTQQSIPPAGEDERSQARAKKREREEVARSARNTEPAVAADPQAQAFDAWMRASQVSLIGIFVIAVLWCVYVAQPVIVPVLLAWVIATIVLPIVKWLQDRGVPRVLAVIGVTLLLVAIIVSLLALLSTPVTYWLGRASEIGGLIKQKLQTISQPLALLDEVRKAVSLIGAGEPTVRVEQQTATVVTTIFSILTPAVSQFILFIGALVFYLVYQKRLRSAAVFLLSDRDARLATLRTLSDIDANMTTYFGAFTIVNACLGRGNGGADLGRGAAQPAAVGRAGRRAQLRPVHRARDRHRHAERGGAADLQHLERSCRRAADLSRHRHHRRAIPDADADGAPAGAQPVRGLSCDRLLHLAVGAARRLPGGAAADGTVRDARPRLRRGKT